MNDAMKKYLCAIGLSLPENEDELQVFEDAHKDFKHEADESKINPYEILERINQKKTSPASISGKDYHKRTVLAAEIVFQLKDDSSLGHLKLQKLMFLCQKTSGMALHTNFLRQAMGPFDPKLMRSIDSQFKKNKWFEYQRDGFPKYLRLEKCGGHKEWYERYFSDQIGNIDFLIKTFKQFKTYQIELVGTIYACWLNSIEQKYIISEKLLISKVYEWHKSKKDKFSEDQIVKAIGWMKENGIYPK